MNHIEVHATKPPGIQDFPRPRRRPTATPQRRMACAPDATPPSSSARMPRRDCTRLRLIALDDLLILTTLNYCVPVQPSDPTGHRTVARTMPVLVHPRPMAIPRAFHRSHAPYRMVTLLCSSEAPIVHVNDGAASGAATVVSPSHLWPDPTCGRIPPVAGSHLWPDPTCGRIPPVASPID